MIYQPHIEDAQDVLTDDEIIALMPKSFVFIAELIGIPATLRFINAYGGTLPFIPTHHGLNVQHDITGIIGLKNLQILAKHIGGQRLEVPMGTHITTHMRFRLIQQAIDRGEPKAKIARRFGVTPRTIRSAHKVKIKIPTKDQNLDLFEN